MKRHVYRERDYGFGQLVLTLRTTLCLTQAGLADRLGVSRRAVAEWEAGESYPKAERLKAFIELCVRTSALPPGREEEEIRALWRAAHQKVLLDEAWLAALLAPPAPVQLSPPAGTPAAHAGGEPAAFPHVDLVEALDVSHFTGREVEVAELTQWILQERCRLVGVLGMGGIGKSALASFLVSRLAQAFEAVLWRSLRDAPPCEELVADCITFFSETPPAGFPTSLEQRITQLVARLQARRCLLVLDNLETILSSGDREGSYLPGYEGYGRLIGRLAESAHQSCVLLTSREEPKELAPLEGVRSPVRTLRLVLRQQVGRLSPLEHLLLTWLAVLREWTTLDTLSQVLHPRVLRAQVLEALEALSRRSLLERGQQASFGLQSVVMEYLTDELGEQFSQEIVLGPPQQLRQVALAQAQAKDYVRETQVRLLVQPLEERLRAELGANAQVEAHLLRQLSQFRREDAATQGYGPANVLSLLKALRGHLRGLNLSGLFIRGAYLQGVEMQDATLAGETLQDTDFTSTFDAIVAVATSLNGTFWAAGSRRGEVWVWEAASQTLHRAWQAHTDNIYALTFSPDGRTLASGSWDGAIKLWDMEGGALLWKNWSTDSIERLAFAPDGRTLASGSFDRTVNLWDMDSRRVRETLTGHTNLVHATAWSPDGRLVASCGFDKTIWIWDVERRSYRTALHGHTAAVFAIAFTPDSRRLLSGSDDATLRVWDMESGQCVHIMQSYAVLLYEIAWSHDGSQLASAGSDRLVIIWDMAARMPPRVLHGHPWFVFGVVWSPDDRLLASSGWDDTMRIWDASTGSIVLTLRDPDRFETFFYSIAWSPDGKFLASGSYQQGVQVWELTTGQCRWVGQTDTPARIRKVAWSPDGTRLASCGDDGSVCLWQTSDGTLLAKLQKHRGLAASVAWSPDGTWLASGGGSNSRGELFIWEARSGECLYTLSEPNAVVHALAWNPSGTLLLRGSSDGMLRWWDLKCGECVRVRKAHQGTIQSLKCSPDGSRLASGGDDGVINIWDIESSEHLRTLRRDRPYQRLNITGIRGLTQAQKATLRALGAVQDEASNSPEHTAQL